MLLGQKQPELGGEAEVHGSWERGENPEGLLGHSLAQKELLLWGAA